MKLTTSRAVSRREDHLQQLKGSLIKNALDTHFLGDHDHQPIELQLSLSNAFPPTKTVVVHMPREDRKRSSGPESSKATSAKGKEKVATDDEFAVMGADLSLCICNDDEDNDISLDLSL